MGKKSRLAEAGRFCQLRIGVARLVERFFGILTGFLTRRLILLAGLVLGKRCS